jgi:hypothetical protein
LSKQESIIVKIEIYSIHIIPIDFIMTKYVADYITTKWIRDICNSMNVKASALLPEEIRGQIPSDYGRAKGIAWYYLGGFALTQTQALQTRIVKWDSQA